MAAVCATRSSGVSSVSNAVTFIMEAVFFSVEAPFLDKKKTREIQRIKSVFV